MTDPPPGWHIATPHDNSTAPTIIVYVDERGELRIRVKDGDQPIPLADAQRIARWLLDDAPALIRQLRSLP